MTSSSSSSSSSKDNRGGGGIRRTEFEGPSSSRLRLGSSSTNNEVWPEPFLESLAYQIAIDVSQTNPLGRLAVASSLSNFFQVCTTWRAISRSDLLWHNLTRTIWRVTNLKRDSWYEEYIHCHRTAYNFRVSRSVHTVLNFTDLDNYALTCRCLSLSDRHLACGFDDGSVCLFDLTSKLHVSTFLPHERDQLGLFSRAVSGMVLTDSKLVFASLDGDVHVVIIRGPGSYPGRPGPGPRRVQLGNVVEDGSLVEFGGSNQWWIGLYAGVPGRSFHIWNGETEELVFIGGSLTDPDSLMGWYLLTELIEPQLVRVRVSNEHEIAVACNGVKIMSFDLTNLGFVLNEEEDERGGVVSLVDISSSFFLLVENPSGVASVRRVDNFEEVNRFNVWVGGGGGVAGGGGGGGGDGRRGVIGCMNSGCIFISIEGVIRVWDIKNGEYLYEVGFRERNINRLVVNERYLVGSSSDGRIHLWDYNSG